MGVGVVGGGGEKGRNYSQVPVPLQLSAAANHTALGIWAISTEAHPSRHACTYTPMHTYTSRQVVTKIGLSMSAFTCKKKKKMSFF